MSMGITVKVHAVSWLIRPVAHLSLLPQQSPESRVPLLRNAARILIPWVVQCEEQKRTDAQSTVPSSRVAPSTLCFSSFCLKSLEPAPCSASQPGARAGLGRWGIPGIMHPILGDNKNVSAERPNTIHTDHNADTSSMSSCLRGEANYNGSNTKEEIESHKLPPRLP